MTTLFDNATDAPTTTQPDAVANGQQLDGMNLQEVLDSGRNAVDVGRQQFFTPTALATALMMPMPPARHTFVDLQMGAGSLLKASRAQHLMGVDIDPRCARRPDLAAGDWHTCNADITKLYELLAEVGWQYDIGGFNPPFSVEWHNERLASLANSDCESVRESYRPGKETIDSTLGTALIAMDRLTKKGEFFLLCNQSTAVRLFGDPDYSPPKPRQSYSWEAVNVRQPKEDPFPQCQGSPMRRHIWLWVTIPAGQVFENVRHDFETAVLYFARDHYAIEGQPPLHLTSTSAEALAVQSLLAPWRNQRAMIRRGFSLWNDDEFSKTSLPLFDAAKAEYHTRYRSKWACEFNLWLEKGRIRRHLTPFQASSKKLPKDLVAALNDLDNRTPMELVVQRETRTALLRAVRSDHWRVDPKLLEATDAAVASYNCDRAPFYPLTEVQRLGFLDESDEIQCRKTGMGFVAGEFYPLTCTTLSTERQGQRINIFGEPEDVTYHGQDLVVKIRRGGTKGEKEGWHGFTSEPKYTTGLEEMTPHDMGALIEYFVIPEVPDVAMTQVEAYETNLRIIEQIEARTNGKLKLRNYQRDDLARFAVHNGGILGWDPGLGKTLGMGVYPQLKNAKRTLIVAPDSLHQQIIDDLFNLLGIEVHILRNQEEFTSDRKLHRAWLDVTNGVASEVTGWWITSYTQLGMNGGDEWQDKENDAGQKFVTAKTAASRQKLEGFDPTYDFGCGLEKNGIRCLFRPTLATLACQVFDCVQVDEGVRLKGDKSYISTGVRRMRPLYRAVMTGTPIKNRLDDIFWLCHWASGGNEDACSRWPYPNTIEAKNEFANQHMLIEQNHTKEEKEREKTGVTRRFEKRTAQLTNVHRLWKLLCNVVIRRRKDAIGEDIVPKTVVPITIPPGRSQQAVYSFHVRNPPEFRKDGQEMNAVAAIVTQLQLLRQAALCPDSPNLSADRLSAYKLKAALMEELGGTKPGKDPTATRRAKSVAVLATQPGTAGEASAALAALERMMESSADRIDLAAVIEAAPSLRSKLLPLVMEPDPEKRPKDARSWTDHNPKQTAILKLVEELISKGEQVVIMSPFQHFSESLYRRLVQASVSVCLLDGNTTPTKRGQLSKEFKRFKYAVMIGGIQSMGEGHSWDQCANLILPSLEWAFDKNRQAEDRVHRLTSKKPVTIYTMVTGNSIDTRLFSLYMEKSDSSHLALDGRLFADRTEEVSLGQLLSEALASFDEKAETICELVLEKEWESTIKPRLRIACQRFGEWHPPIAIAAEKVTKREVRQAVRNAGLGVMISIVKAVPDATFGALIGSRDAGVIECCKRDFMAFCESGDYSDWRRAWRAFDDQRQKVTSPVKAKVINRMAERLSALENL